MGGSDSGRTCGAAGAEGGAKELGRLGERVARDYLEQRGYEVLCCNYRCRAGEADIVAQDGGETVLVEVKLRRAYVSDETFPELAVDARKQARYRGIAACYLAEHPRAGSVRFDVVAVRLVGSQAYVQHIVGAFDGSEVG